MSWWAPSIQIRDPIQIQRELSTTTTTTTTTTASTITKTRKDTAISSLGSSSSTTNVAAADIADPLSPESLYRILECPVCMEVPFPPIYQCVKGHNVCKTCRPKLKICAICRGKFSETRNYAIEQIILSSSHACPYKTNGCKVVQSWDYMRNHTLTCLFKPIRCPMIGDTNAHDKMNCRCQTNELELSEIKDHLLTVHNAEIHTGAIHSISHVFFSRTIDNETSQIQFAYKPNILEVRGTYFWAPIFRLNHMIYWTVLCIGTKEESSKYTASIALGPHKIPSIHWTIPVNPISRGTEHVYMDPPTVMNMYNPSCSISDFKKFADLGKLQDGTPYYSFITAYTIYENETVHLNVNPVNPVITLD